MDMPFDVHMPFDLRRATSDVLDVRRVFGEPVDRDGVTVIPVARVLGGGGGGGGTADPGETEGAGAGQRPVAGGAGSGAGGGLGSAIRPLGVYVIRNGEVSWQPALDVTRVALGGQLVGAIAVLALALALRRRRR